MQGGVFLWVRKGILRNRKETASLFFFFLSIRFIPSVCRGTILRIGFVPEICRGTILRIGFIPSICRGTILRIEFIPEICRGTILCIGFIPEICRGTILCIRFIPEIGRGTIYDRDNGVFLLHKSQKALHLHKKTRSYGLYL